MPSFANDLCTGWVGGCDVYLCPSFHVSAPPTSWHTLRHSECTYEAGQSPREISLKPLWFHIAAWGLLSRWTQFLFPLQVLGFYSTWSYRNPEVGGRRRIASHCNLQEVGVKRTCLGQGLELTVQMQACTGSWGPGFHLQSRQHQNTGCQAWWCIEAEARGSQWIWGQPGLTQRGPASENK